MHHLKNKVKQVYTTFKTPVQPKNWQNAYTVLYYHTYFSQNKSVILFKIQYLILEITLLGKTRSCSPLVVWKMEILFVTVDSYRIVSRPTKVLGVNQNHSTSVYCFTNTHSQAKHDIINETLVCFESLYIVLKLDMLHVNEVIACMVYV